MKYKLVPQEPTSEMINVIIDCLHLAPKGKYVQSGDYDSIMGKVADAYKKALSTIEDVEISPSTEILAKYKERIKLVENRNDWMKHTLDTISNNAHGISVLTKHILDNIEDKTQ